MLMRPLPFASLRVFEAVARLQSFSRAAEQLGMTQSAVSQHVRGLEDWTGRRLILRGRLASLPTDEGKRLARAVAEGVAGIEGVLQELRLSKTRQSSVTVACPAGFAVNWLFPRLYHFDQDHPTIPVSVLTQSADGFAADAEADVAIIYAPHPPPGLKAVKLFGEQVFPVCSPVLLKGAAGIGATSDLARHTLLVDSYAPSKVPPPDWAFWADETGQKLPDPVRIRRFSQANMTVQAAAQGEGVALGRGSLVMDALRTGTLVAPLPHRAMSRHAYWFAFMPAIRAQNAADELLQWLLATILALVDADDILARTANRSDKSVI